MAKLMNVVTLTNGHGIVLFETHTLCKYVSFNSTHNGLVFGEAPNNVWFTVNITANWLCAHGALILSVRSV
jgi:hypothetical protein